MTITPEQCVKLRAEIEAAVTDFRVVFPAPWRLAPNLEMAVRALAVLDQVARSWDEDRASLFRQLETAWGQRDCRVSVAEALGYRDQRNEALATLDQMERERGEARVAVERVRALHRSIPVCATCPGPDDCPTPDAEHGEDIGGSGEWLHLDEVEFEACEVCRDEDGAYVDWPCETIRTLDGAAPDAIRGSRSEPPRSAPSRTKRGGCA